jgi:ectoine hydroxylase-related dioxygenase (phytanoyl-CoA dioxygenase family)
MITDEQLREFASNGYLLLPHLVDDELLAAVDAEIDALIAADPVPESTTGAHFYFLPPDELPAADAALHESGALEAAGQLVAPLAIGHGLAHIQVALNVPPYSHRPGSPHIDGHRPDLDRPSSFTMLGAIYLSDETEEDRGNLWVWPGSHLVHQEYFRRHGAKAFLATSGQPGLLAEPPRYHAMPAPLRAGRADVLLAHFLLGHNIGGNTSAATRRIVYFRLSCAGHAERWADTFTDAFTEYAPVERALVGQPG